MNENIKYLYIDILKRDPEKIYRMCNCDDCKDESYKKIVVFKCLDNRRPFTSYFLSKRKVNYE